jgi:parallel beta-helix repeat protein
MILENCSRVVVENQSMAGPGQVSGGNPTVAIELKNSHRCRIQYNDIKDYKIGVKLSNGSDANVIAYNDFTNVENCICSNGAGNRNRAIENWSGGSPSDNTPNVLHDPCP